MHKKNYVQISYIMERDNRTRKYFENLMRSKHNHERVIRRNGAIYVDADYDNPLRIEIENLLYSALEKTKNLHHLASQLSNCTEKDSTNKIYLYLRYQSFKHNNRAVEIKDLLEQFLQKCSEL